MNYFADRFNAISNLWVIIISTMSSYGCFFSFQSLKGRPPSVSLFADDDDNDGDWLDWDEDSQRLKSGPTFYTTGSNKSTSRLFEQPRGWNSNKLLSWTDSAFKMTGGRQQGGGVALKRADFNYCTMCFLTWHCSCLMRWLKAIASCHISDWVSLLKWTFSNIKCIFLNFFFCLQPEPSSWTGFSY